MLVLSREDILKVLKMDALIEVMEDGFRELAEGDVEMPLRPMLSSREPLGTTHVMPAIMRKSRALGLKVVAHYIANPSKYGVPVINGTIVYNDFNTGRVLSVMDGTYLTAMRTAAVSGVATRYLSRKDSKVVGLLGSGVQAETHLEAMSKVRDITSARVYSPTPSHRDAYARKVSAKLGIDVRAVDSGREAVAGSDIVVTATPARAPIVLGDWLSEGIHVNAIGSGTPELREVDEVVLSKSKIVADDIDAAVAETGDFITPMREGKFRREDIYACLGDLVIGSKPGRTSDKEITLFKSVGLAIEDVAAAKFIYENARAQSVGTEVPI